MTPDLSLPLEDPSAVVISQPLALANSSPQHSAVAPVPETVAPEVSGGVCPATPVCAKFPHSTRGLQSGSLPLREGTYSDVSDESSSPRPSSGESAPQLAGFNRPTSALVDRPKRTCKPPDRLNL